MSDIFRISNFVLRIFFYDARVKRADHIRAFTETIWEWFDAHKRELPWRDLSVANDTERAYRILVSEVMLQQTQVPRVKIVYKKFLERFPKIRDLASATNRDVLIEWRGLGYNSRALRLRDATAEIVRRGAFPTEMTELRSIKGIGQYTAAAVRNFAFNLPTPCLDTNIRRILHRAFFGPEDPDGTFPVDDRRLLSLAEEILTVALSKPPSCSLRTGATPFDSAQAQGRLHPQPAHDARNWHAALMDFGSIICTKRNPKWDLCPLTARGLMKAAYKVTVDPAAKCAKKEPGRLVGSTFVPNRIFRGRIVEALRDAKARLPLHVIGSAVCIDWNAAEHEAWLTGLLEKLEKDGLVRLSRGSWELRR